VLEGERARLRTADNGRRNHELNRAAFAVARVVAGGELLEVPARAMLLAEALRIGLTEHESSLTIESAFRAGSLRPRSAPHRFEG
jgi:replicative DNA helicase